MTLATADRRRGRRHARPEEHGIVSARVRPGYDVEVIDASAGGALVESSRRLLPGTGVELHVQRRDRPPQIVRGEVLRCSVARLGASSVSYRGAIAFERQLSWFSQDGPDGYPIPRPEIEGSNGSGHRLPASGQE